MEGKIPLKLDTVKDRVVFITGGASGIGFGIAQAAGRAGAKVVIGDIEEAALTQATEQLRSLNIIAESCVCDVRSLTSMEEAARNVVDRFGQVDLVCNNAGVICEMDSRDWSDSGWKWVIDVNLMGIVHGVQAFRPYFARQDEAGYFVNTVSQAAFYGGAFVSQYTATKFAALGLSESLREELEPERIGLSILCAGGAATNILNATRNAPAEVRGNIKAPDIDASKVTIVDPDSGHMRSMTSPIDMGNMVLEGIARGDIYIFTDESAFARIFKRFEWLRAAEAQVQQWERMNTNG